MFVAQSCRPPFAIVSRLARFVRLFEAGIKHSGQTTERPTYLKMAPRRKAGEVKRFRKKSKNLLALEGSAEEVLLFDVQTLLRAHAPKDELDASSNANSPTAGASDPTAANEPQEASNQGSIALRDVLSPALPKQVSPAAPGQVTTVLPNRFSDIELDISVLSSTGDGLAFDAETKHVYVVPFTAPGDKVTATVIRHYPDQQYSKADFVKVLTPSSLRDDSRVRCQYFQACSGCQFQMLSYPIQLLHKQRIIEMAYKHFSGLNPRLVPEVSEVTASPLEYGYRTKLTPHFDGPPGFRRKGRKTQTEGPLFQEVPPIGFLKKGMKVVVDIEDCPIGTEVVRAGLRKERKSVANEIHTYKRGATLLLRESTKKIFKTEDAIDINSAEDKKGEPADPLTIREDHSTYILEKTCVTDPKATASEYVFNFQFRNTAGAFFQNNNSILPVFTSYIRAHARPSVPFQHHKIKYLIDAYCGSGLFSIILSSLFLETTGIDISSECIMAALLNATRNGITNSKFMEANAAALFASVTYLPEETVVVVDPPRKGCDEEFLRQVAKYGPSRIIYVSCNVHTQARDIGILIDLTAEDGETGAGYEIESLKGFDFFPQTSHVESVAILNKKRPSKAAEQSSVAPEQSSVVT